MRFWPGRFVCLFAASSLALSACSNPLPPIGRWEGAYDDPGVIIVARLEINRDGDVRVSAPNAITSETVLTTDERAGLRRRLQAGLATSWPSVGPLPLDFDGRAFHRPGGVAPQLEWDDARKRMTLVFYSGRASLRVPLTAVKDFGGS